MLTDRQERLKTLARLAVENDLSPLKNTFAGFIIKVCCTNYGLSRIVAKQDLGSLVTAWNGDKWKTLLHDREEGKAMDVETLHVRTFEQAESETKKFIATMKPSGEPIKHIEPQVAFIADDRPLSRREMAIILDSIAHRDTFNGVGRVLLSEARDKLDCKNLSMKDMVDIYQNKYPTVEIERATGNVMLVYFDGKDAVRFARKANRIIQPSEPIFKPSENEVGDVYDDVDE